MPDWMIPLAINALIQIARDGKAKSKWRKALLKVFREIARSFSADADFADVVKEEM